MKITCEYCGNTFNDTETQCPFCGSPNKGVVRTAQSEPKTIEELKDWYEKRGLPPYETTRFFIGVDYREPRAFGIFKDEASGICTVYKNKDTGERAIRYQGTDEAYAVNELLQRLKQEILQQKKNSMTGSRSMPGNASADNESLGKTLLKTLGFLAAVFGGIFAGAMVLIILVGVIINVAENQPKDGYYSYDGTTYYYDTDGYDDSEMNWFGYDSASGEWTGPIARDGISSEMAKNKKAKKYFLQSDWDSSLGCSNFADSTLAADMAAGFFVAEGYYRYNDDVYYHLDDYYNSGWYMYDDSGWSSVSDSDLPEEMNHSSEVNDFYYTSTWDSSTQVTDFTDTQEYADYQEAQSSSDSSDSWSDDDDSDYDWSSSSDSWDSGSSDWGSDW